MSLLVVRLFNGLRVWLRTYEEVIGKDQEAPFKFGDSFYSRFRI